MENKSDCWPYLPHYPFYFNHQMFMNSYYQYPNTFSYPPSCPEIEEEKDVKKEDPPIFTKT